MDGDGEGEGDDGMNVGREDEDVTLFELPDTTIHSKQHSSK